MGEGGGGRGGERRSYGGALHVEAAASQLLSSSNARARSKASYPEIGSSSSTSHTKE